MAERVTRQQVEVAASGDGDVRVTQQAVEILSSAAVIYNETADNTLAMSQSATAQKISSPSASSTLAMSQATEANTIDAEASSTLALTTTSDYSGPLPQEDVTSTLGLTQAASKTFGSLGRGASSTLALDQEADQNIKNLYAESLAEELGLDTTTRLAETYELTADNSLALTQTALGQSLSPKAESTLVLSQFADNKNKQRSVENTLALSQAATAENIKTVESVITLTQIADRGAIEKYATNALSLSSSAKANPINRSLSNTLALSQTVRQSIRNVSASTQIELAQDVHVVRPYYLSGSNELTGTEVVFDPDTFLPIVVSTAIEQEATFLSDPTRAAESIISFAQSAVPVLLKATATAKSATTTLTLSQSAITGFAAEASNSITLTQDADGVIAYTAVTELSQDPPDDESEITSGLRDEARYQVFKAQAVASALAIRQTVLYELIVDTTECDYTPFVGTTDDPDLPTPPSTTLPAPFAGRTTDRIRLVYPDFTVTDAPSLTITLRAPQFGNREGVQSLRINRETRGGSLIVFADPLWPQFTRLVMQFQALSQAQALDLLAFLDDSLGHVIGLQDYEGRAWKGVVTNPSEAVVHDRKGCNYSASIEMEAELVNMPGLDAETEITLLDAPATDFGAYGRAANTALGLASTSESDGVHNEAASTPLALVGEAVSSGTSGRAAETALGLSGTAGRFATLGKPLTSSLGLSDAAEATRVVTLSAASTAVVTQSSGQNYTIDRVGSSALALTDAPGKSRIRDMANRPSDAQLVMVHETSYDAVWSRAGTSAISASDEALGAILLPTFSGSLKHRWDATQLSLSDGADILTVTDGGSGSVNLRARGGGDTQAPTYKTNILNGQPVMRFVQGTIGQALESLSNTTLFPSKRGTVAIVVVPRESLAGTSSRFYLFDHRNGTNIEQLHFGGETNTDRPFPWSATSPDSTDGLETPPPNYAPEGEGQILIVNRDSDNTLIFRRNGVAETGRSLAGNPVPVSGIFTMGGNGQAAQSIDVDIAVCLVYDKSLSTAEMIELEAYLKVVYGIR